MRYMCGPIRVRVASGKSRRKEACSRCGTRAGESLFYRSGDKMMAVEIATRLGFTAGRPRVLFEGRYATNATFPDYDVSPDGQRFLMLKPDSAHQAAPTQINIVLNWFEELKRKVPVGN